MYMYVFLSILYIYIKVFRNLLNMNRVKYLDINNVFIDMYQFLLYFVILPFQVSSGSNIIVEKKMYNDSNCNLYPIHSTKYSYNCDNYIDQETCCLGYLQHNNSYDICINKNNNTYFQYCYQQPYDYNGIYVYFSAFGIVSVLFVFAFLLYKMSSLCCNYNRIEYRYKGGYNTI
jgi:hypothetical protein